LESIVLQPGGQQLSIVAPLQASVAVQRALHVAGEPEYVSQQWVHAVGQLDGGSHVSPAFVSTVPSPHPAQSESWPGEQPTGQH
jgi:hypothetical protein